MLKILNNFFNYNQKLINLIDKHPTTEPILFQWNIQGSIYKKRKPQR